MCCSGTLWIPVQQSGDLGQIEDRKELRLLDGSPDEVLAESPRSRRVRATVVTRIRWTTVISSPCTLVRVIRMPAFFRVPGRAMTSGVPLWLRRPWSAAAERQPAAASGPAA
jgi:hypothetical protein